jgi:hypothetical protein
MADGSRLRVGGQARPSDWQTCASLRRSAKPLAAKLGSEENQIKQASTDGLRTNLKKLKKV